MTDRSLNVLQRIGVAHPKHWASTKIKHLFRIQKRPPKPGDQVVTAFRDGTVTLRALRRTQGFTEALQESGYQRVLKGDFVIHAMDAFAGAIGVSDSDGKCSPVYSVCRPGPEIEPRYFAYLMRHLAKVGYIASLAKGIRERSSDFRWSESSNLVVPVPPIDEQVAIADYLDNEIASIDANIEMFQNLIDLLKEKRSSIVGEAVSGSLEIGEKHGTC